MVSSQFIQFILHESSADQLRTNLSWQGEYKAYCAKISQLNDQEKDGLSIVLMKISKRIKLLISQIEGYIDIKNDPERRKIGLDECPPIVMIQDSAIELIYVLQAAGVLIQNNQELIREGIWDEVMESTLKIHELYMKIISTVPADVIRYSPLNEQFITKSIMNFYVFILTISSKSKDQEEV